MRAAYLVRPRDPKLGATRELPSETTGKAPELIEVPSDTDWLSSFPEEQSKMWSVVTRDSAPPLAEAQSVRSSAPAYIPPYAPPYAPGPSMRDYWPHAAGVAVAILLLGGIIGWFLTRDGGTATADQVSVSALTTPGERAPASRAAAPPAVASNTPAPPQIQKPQSTRRNDQKPATPPSTQRPAAGGLAAAGSPAATSNVRKDKPAATAPPPPAKSPKASPTKSNDLPVRNPTAPIVSPIPVRALPGAKEPPPPATNPPLSPDSPVPAGTAASLSTASVSGAATAPKESAAPPPPAPTPTPTPAAAAANSPSARAVATASVQSVLERYRQAYSTLNASALPAVWPTVNASALARAFNQLEAQRFDFDNCQIEISGPLARAICTGTANFITKVGSKAPRVESRRWTFQLSQAKGSWIIDRVESR